MRQYKRAFTLIEIMVCMVIIGMAAGVLAFSLKDILNDYYFTRSVTDFRKNLEHFERLAVTIQSDSKILVEKRGEKFWYKCKMEDPAFPKIEKELDGVVKLLFDDEETESLSLNIYANGYVKPRGSIAFSTKNGKTYKFERK